MPMTSVPEALLAARAAQQADIVHKHKVRALLQRRRRLHEHRVHVFAATTAGVLLAGVLASGFYLGVISMPTRSVADKSGSGSFAETKTGQLMMPTDGGWCKTRSFNNVTGEFTNSQLVNCDDFNNNNAGTARGRKSSFSDIADSFRRH
jgi:hypothetical protein